jgi:hypothetical protein
MSKRIAALAAEKGGVGTGDWHHQGRAQQQDSRIRHDKQAYKDRNVIERCYLQAQGLQAHRNALRQTRSELLLSPVPRCRRGILALVVRGFRFWG